MGNYVGKHLSVEDAESLFDAMYEEIFGYRMVEKCKVRNRRACERKARVRNPRYVKRNGGNFRRDVWYEGSKCFHWEEDLRMPERRERSKEMSDRADWDTELSALSYEIDCAEFMLESDLDDLAWLKNEIFEIGNPDGTIALYEERIKELRKNSERKAKLEQYKVDTEKRIRNGKEYMRKYNYVKEMI